MPVIGSVLLGHFFGKWRAGEMTPVWFSLAVTVILAVVIAIVAILTSLAPIRAEVEYGDKIRVASQQLAMYQEDGDKNAIRFAQQNLTDVKAQQHRSAEWNMALVPISATAEFATGFFFPLALPLLLLIDARTSRRKVEGSLAASENSLTNQRAAQYSRLSVRFQRLGLTQLQLQQHLATVNAENSRDAEPVTPIENARSQVAGELLAQAPATMTSAAPDQAITAEIVTTSEFPPAGSPVRLKTSPRDSAAVPRPEPIPTAAPIGLLERNGDLPDESFDLS
jgi:hypothetical protein